MCDCGSYNLQIGKAPEKILDIASYFPEITDRPNGVCIDSCIAEPIKALWSAGIYTTGSCCGHNIDAGSVILENKKDIAKARSILAGSQIKVIQVWELSRYNVPLPGNGHL